MLEFTPEKTQLKWVSNSSAAFIHSGSKRPKNGSKLWYWECKQALQKAYVMTVMARHYTVLSKIWYYNSLQNFLRKTKMPKLVLPYTAFPKIKVTR